MKQKVVIKVASMNTPKSRTKAMKIAVGLPGVVSAELSGDSKDQIVVIGEGIDATYLTKLLRKKIGFTELVSVAKVDDKKKEEEKNKEVIWNPYPYGYGTPYIITEAHDRYQEPCTIM